MNTKSDWINKLSATRTEYEWTKHSAVKMRHYRLSQQRVKRVIRFPERSEEGILTGAVAVMQPASVRRATGVRKWSQEIWVMYVPDAKRGCIRIITAWRYPGVSPARNPVPQEILDEARSAMGR
jgi:hypothetical protein